MDRQDRLVFQLLVASSHQYLMAEQGSFPLREKSTITYYYLKVTSESLAINHIVLPYLIVQ